MRINFNGRLVDEKEIRAGFIGCGSHSARNIYPTFQFAPVDLQAVCDLSIDKAKAFAKKFGAQNAYSDYREMLEKEDLDAVFIVTGYDDKGRPLYPQLAIDCLNAGCHVWMEKPPAASVKEIEAIQHAAEKAGRNVVVGLKKMFFPANEKAKALASDSDFGQISMAMLQYNQGIPMQEDFLQYINEEKRVNSVIGFLDHLCHPASLMVYLLGMPKTLFYERNAYGAGMAMFTFESGATASIALTAGSAYFDAIERTMIISNKGRHIIVDNNIRVSYHQVPNVYHPYGASPDFYIAPKEQATAIWEPEFSLGQLYNKGLFLLGYYNEVNEFARSILDERKPNKGTLEQAWQVTRIFEGFAEGPGKVINL